MACTFFWQNFCALWQKQTKKKKENSVVGQWACFAKMSKSFAKKGLSHF
jgi:hypothetical protein